MLNKKSGRSCPHCNSAKAYFVGDALLTEGLGEPLAVESRVRNILALTKPLDAEFYRLTGKPLGVTGEIAEFVAAETLGLQLVPARTIGYDALEAKNEYRFKGALTARKQILGSACRV